MNKIRNWHDLSRLENQNYKIILDNLYDEDYECYEDKICAWIVNKRTKARVEYLSSNIFKRCLKEYYETILRKYNLYVELNSN